ncbi:DEAD/DEAH box helicase [Streptomyces sp. B-S-A8]|uniref:DEAD/DEAH box helicase n=1 Tax=Streptomyces solicavernae TaxID=3043614 RepID=A0ABT6RZP5_9ACTN|nr:DEAD/DEAH box helicase [Streptomyces sp. B-S-A8]MDI3389111.1 DEAD/DEAH box helicase [Streptomyces sp. B-S-A8]
MRPTLAAEQVRASLSQYLSTTYALADEGTRGALEQFLGDPQDGIFRGPYLRIRTPFRPAQDDSWQRHLQWWPGITPHRHQELAWRRLSTLHGPAEPTLVTTGTGSGKTESFLVPLLDHCRRERLAGRDGVKAVLLYPMNALATDQAHRINDYLDDPKDTRLRDAGVRAGLYVGDTPSKEFKQANPRVAVDREEIRRTRPDILITNYKMLDLLLQRAEDQPLWQGGSLAYVVLDEFHTYDGAQGTDVAMLLRRLGALAGLAEPGRPLGRVCPVATSATLGEGGAVPQGRASGGMLEVAEQVFGVPFPPEAVVGEDRHSVREFAGDADFTLPFPDPQAIAALGDPTRDAQALERLIAEFTGRSDLSPAELGGLLRRHRLTSAVLEILDGRPRTLAEVMEVLPRYAYHWGVAVQQRPDIAAQALARYVGLLSMARDPDVPSRPLLSIEIHHWVRSVSRVLRGISGARAEFRWDDERVASGGRLARGRSRGAAGQGPVGESSAGQAGEAEPADDSAPEPAQVFLPAVYCRECGRSGWAALSPEADPSELELRAAKIRSASVGRDKRRVRNMIAATAKETYDAAFAQDTGRGAGPTVMVLDGGSGRLRPVSPERDFAPAAPAADGAEEAAGRGEGAAGRVAKPLHNAAFVVVDLAGDRAAQRDECPACRTSNAIRYLGTGLASLAAAALTQLFTGGELDKNLKENKTLLFNDSVQDAAHRAGYVASRSYTFSFRSLLASRIDEQEPVRLSDLAADIIADVVDSKAVQTAVIPPDLHVFRGVDTLLAGRSRGSKRTWELIAQRLAFAAVMEFGLRSRQGRTLELTRTVAADVPLPDPDAVGELVRELLHTTPGDIALPDGSLPDHARYVGYVRGLVERLRTRGAIRHAWLDGWIDEAGVRRWLIGPGRKPGTPAFPRGVSAPAFLLGGPKQGSDDFDVVTGRLGWYQDFTRRALGVRSADAANEFLRRLLPGLAERDVLSVHTAKDGATRVYGLQPGHVQVRKLADDTVAEASAHCPVCSWEQTVHPDLADRWQGQTCPTYRCRGLLRTGRDLESGIRRRDFTEDFYRRMYREAGVYTINTAEHTGTLGRAKREAVEKAFRDGSDVHYANPHVLSCTPTLELGIDIGDLSAVVLASLPKGPANYAQRVGRAGRKTGNAYLLTMVDRGPRDRYYLDDPTMMIAGDIQPPGCFLSAVEILRRQYLAHLLDLAGAGRLLLPGGGRDAVLPLPRLASYLFGESAWLPEFTEAALADGERLAADFLALFPPYDEKRGTGVSPQARAELTEYATEGLRGALDKAHRAWEAARRELQRRVKAIDEAHDQLTDGDPDHERQGRELRAERRAVNQQARTIGNGTAHAALVDLGLLPNYSLIDATTELEATLSWKEEKQTLKGPETEYCSKPLRYERSARLALKDFAPGNHYYVQGYKHRISGLDIGSPRRPTWLWWRVCPDCGHVRTHRAEQDTSACPRCASTAIGDVGCLHKVLVPKRVYARDQRDDVRVRDDRDERERGHYTVIPAVDIDRNDIEQAWRHDKATFGWEFTRRAMVRHLNVGALRTDPGADTAVAGQRVNLNPFWVCDSCGFADADGGPAADHDALVPGAPLRLGRYHRPWCPHLRGSGDAAHAAQAGVKLLLAHELRTEALRILIPAVTAHTQERLVSFKALLLAGIARAYGGDPDHLAVVTDSVPDDAGGDRDVRRHFLVLYDTLPGGTGYLHRLAGPDGLREVLDRARETIETCVCLAEGRPACHRCLLRHVENGEYELVSREHALDMLGELFGRDRDGWNVKETETTRDVTLVPQLESELEALFRRGLLDWAEEVDEVSVRNALTPDGERDITLRFKAPDGTVTGWRMETQTDLGFTIPDVVFRSLDDDRRRVAVYLDGYRHHAHRDRNRIAGDAAKRTRLRSEQGWQVFQFTWDDVQVWTGQRRPPADPAWIPYQNGAQKTAQDLHRRLHQGDPRDLRRYVWTNPIDTLIAYLTDPDNGRWRRRTQSALAAFAAVPATSRALADGPDIGRRIEAALHGEKLSGGQGAVQVMATRDAGGCPLTIVLDLRRGQAGAVWSAITVLDDTEQAFQGPEEAHRRRWRSWLYWTNLLQFLNEGEGDGVQLAVGQLPGFDPLELAVTGGAGWLTSERGRYQAQAPETAEAAEAPETAETAEAAEAAEAAEVPAEPKPEPSATATTRDPVWDADVLPYLVDEPGLADLAEQLAALGAPAPEAGYELGDAAWPTELAWPKRQLGVVLAHAPGPDGTDPDAEDRDRAYARAGWTVRTAPEWDPGSLAGLLADPQATPAPRHPAARHPAPRHPEARHPEAHDTEEQDR